MYKPLSWTDGEMVTLDKIKQMSDNSQALKDAQITAIYNGDQLSVNTGIKMLAGRVGIASTKASFNTKAVDFKNFFSQGCEPIVITSLTSNNGGASPSPARILISVQGWSSQVPDHRGMNVTAQGMILQGSKVGNIPQSIFVDYLVIGY